MNEQISIFDIWGTASRIPYDLMQKLEADIPKFKQLADLVKQAQPHLDALMPLVKQGESIWASVSPDVRALLDAVKGQS